MGRPSNDADSEVQPAMVGSLLYAARDDILERLRRGPGDRGGAGVQPTFLRQLN